MDSMRVSPGSNARRLEAYVRWTLYVLLLLLPVQYAGLLVGAAVGAPRGTVALLLVLLLLAVAVTVCNVLVARWGFDRIMGAPAPIPKWLVVAWSVTGLALVVGTVAVRSPMVAALAWFPVGVIFGAVTPLLTARRTAVICVALTVLSAPLILVASMTTVLGLATCWMLIWSAWATGWMFRVLRELQRAHEVQAQLGVAEERLRISRDLHDVFGRTLATISVKAELAAELARRGHHDRAAEEMAEIRQISNTAGAEVRRVVRGERPESWTGELEGARALLSSAGIRCVIAGDDLPEAYANTLAWVIREGVTNVLRHSRATQVSIQTAVESDEVALTLANDGADVPGPGHDSTGTGLVAMAGRLRAIGGTLDYERDGDWFLLTASLPALQEVAE